MYKYNSCFKLLRDSPWKVGMECFRFQFVREGSLLFPIGDSNWGFGFVVWLFDVSVNGSMVYRYLYLLNERWQRICFAIDWFDCLFICLNSIKPSPDTDWTPIITSSLQHKSCLNEQVHEFPWLRVSFGYIPSSACCRGVLVLIWIDGIGLHSRTVILLQMDSITLKWHKWSSNF